MLLLGLLRALGAHCQQTVLDGDLDVLVEVDARKLGLQDVRVVSYLLLNPDAVQTGGDGRSGKSGLDPTEHVGPARQPPSTPLI